MRITDVDKNFQINNELNKDDILWYESDKSPFTVYGAYSTNPYKRIPTEVAQKIGDRMEFLHTNTAGIRIRFRTDSPYLALHVEWDQQTVFYHMATTGVCSFDLYSYDANSRKQSFVIPIIAPTDAPNGYDGICELTGEMKDYVLNFPLYNNVTKLYIGVKENSKFEEPAKYINELPIVFYGSSITQGACASRPGNCYINILSRKLDFDYINLGFAGNALAEDEMVDYLSKLKMSIFVSDYDHNAPEPEYLEKTHYRMYERIRRANPDLPYVLLSRPNYIFDENGDARRKIVMETFCKALQNGDRNIHFIDGASIFAEDEYDACTVDLCHPNDLGFYRFAQALYPTFREILKKQL